MNTLRFDYLLKQVAALAGLDTSNLPTTFFRQMREFAAIRLDYAWRTAAWPECVSVINYTGFVNGTALNANHAGVLWVADRDLNDDPTGDVLTHRLFNDKLYLDWPEDSIYVAGWTKPPELVGEVYAASTTYASGDQVYSGGTFYNSAANNNLNNAPSDQTNNGDVWTPVNIPKIFQHYLVRGLFADYLRSKGEMEKALQAEAEAEATLDEERNHLISRQGQSPQIAFTG